MCLLFGIRDMYCSYNNTMQNYTIFLNISSRERLFYIFDVYILAVGVFGLTDNGIISLFPIHLPIGDCLHRHRWFRR